LRPKASSITGVFLDADLERLIGINLPLVEHKETVFYNGKELSTVTLKYGEFICMGDFHYGHECFTNSVLQGYLRYLKEHPNIMIGIMGDVLEYGEGRHFIREDEKVPVDEQISMFVSDFKPFKDRIKFMLWGNHEEKFVTKSGSKRLLDSIARELGLEPNVDVYMGKPQKGIFIAFRAGEKEYGAKVHHSKTSARVNRDIQLRRSGSQHVVSLIVHGHTHALGWKPRTFRAIEILDGKVYNTVRRQYLLSTGCFLKYPGYAEAASMPYTDVGAPIVRFYAEEDNLQCYDLTGCYRKYFLRPLDERPKPTTLQTQYTEAPSKKCPKCGSTQFHKNGMRKGKQRYRCNECGTSTTEE